MLTTKQILKNKPTFILSVNYDAGSLAEMLGNYDRDDNSHNEYLAEMTIQYYSLSLDACLSFHVECLVSVTGDTTNIVTIEEMDTSSDMQAVYVKNIDSLPNGSHYVWGHDTDSELHTVLLELIENQPIYDAPNNFIIESY